MHNAPLWMKNVLFLKIRVTAITNNDIFVLGKCMVKSLPSDSRTETEKLESLAQDIGAKGKKFMKKNIAYTDEPSDVDLDNARRMADFLPRPEELTLKKERGVTVRFNELMLAEIKKAADQKGLGVSSLIRMWVLDRLDKTQPHT